MGRSRSTRPTSGTGETRQQGRHRPYLMEGGGGVSPGLPSATRAVMLAAWAYAPISSLGFGRYPRGLAGCGARAYQARSFPHVGVFEARRFACLSLTRSQSTLSRGRSTSSFSQGAGGAPTSLSTQSVNPPPPARALLPYDLSRAVLARGGKAERLTYDHKAEDASEQERVNAAGGFVLRNRVLGILAVSRSFGNQGMKELVTAVPHVSETT